MKKILLILAFLVILVAIPLTVFLVKQSQEIRQRAASTTLLFFSPEHKQNNPLSVNQGDTFDLNIQMDTAQNQVVGVQLSLSFSAQYLEIIDLQPAGTLTPKIISDKQLGNGTAVITLGPDNPQTAPAIGRGNIAKVTFRALATTSTPTPINLGTSQVSGRDDPGRNLLIGTESAFVLINQATGASPSPSASGQIASPSVSPSTTTASPSPSSSSGTGGGTASPSPSPSVSPSTTTASPSSSIAVSPSPTSTQVTKITSPANGTTVNSRRPVISGTSFPNALIILSISNVSTPPTTFRADASGNWSYTPTVDLANGTYTVTVTGDSGSSGALENASSTFTVSTSGTGGTTVASPSPSAAKSTSTASKTTSTSTASAIPVTADTQPTIILITIALLMLAFGSFATVFTKL